MKHGVWVLRTPATPDMQEMLEFAVAAEESGWDGVFVSDSIAFQSTDPWVTLSAIAARTERVTLGTWITAPAQQPPWRLAQALASLDRLSGGRVLLGTGLGVGDDFSKFGDDLSPAARARKYDESLDLMARFWTGQPVTFDGEFYQVKDVTLPILPLQQPRIPVVVGGWWPNKKPFHRAAAWDGLMPYWPALLGGQVGPEGQTSTGTSEGELRDLMAYYRDVAQGAGEIVIPREQPDDPAFDALAEELGATWLLSAYGLDFDEVRQGPPR